MSSGPKRTTRQPSADEERRGTGRLCGQASAIFPTHQVERTMSGIFLIQGGGALVERKEDPYETEDVLQHLPAPYPTPRGGNKRAAPPPRRWLLVSREM